MWNKEEAKTWILKYIDSLKVNGQNNICLLLLYDIYNLNVCASEQSFIKSLKMNANLDDIYIQWVLKEIKHDG